MRSTTVLRGRTTWVAWNSATSCVTWASRPSVMALLTMTAKLDWRSSWLSSRMVVGALWATLIVHFSLFVRGFRTSIMTHVVTVSLPRGGAEVTGRLTLMAELTHIDASGNAHMVDVSEKDVTSRTATAKALVEMQAATLSLILEGKAKKGDVIATARIAGIMAAKKTHELIPLCHPLMISKVTVDFAPDTKAATIEVTATVIGESTENQPAFVALNCQMVLWKSTLFRMFPLNAAAYIMVEMLPMVNVFSLNNWAGNNGSACETDRHVTKRPRTSAAANNSSTEL